MGTSVGYCSLKYVWFRFFFCFFFFFFFFFFYFFVHLDLGIKKPQRLPFPSSTTAEWKSGNFCHTHVFSLFHGKHHRARDTWKWQQPEEPILCWWFSETNLSPKRVAQPADLYGRLAHKSSSGFFCFSEARKAPKNRARSANEREHTGPPSEPEMRSEGLLRKFNRLG